jgi:hypothetical protein
VIPIRAAAIAALALSACAGADGARTEGGGPGASASSASATSSVARRAPGLPPEECPKLASEVETVRAVPGATLFTTDGRDLVWTNGRAIFRAPVGGGDERRIVDPAVSVATVTQLEIDRDEIWVAAAQHYERGCIGRLGFLAPASKALERVGPDGCLVDFTLTPGEVVFTTQGVDPGGGHIVGTLYAAPRKAGASAKVLHRNFNGSSDVTTDGQHALLSILPGLHRVALGGGGDTEQIHDGRAGDVLNGPKSAGLAADASHLYFFHGHPNFNGYRVARVAVTGGELELLGVAVPASPRGEAAPQGAIALDDRHVYWTSPTEGEVRRVDKEGSCEVEVVAARRARPDWVRVAGGYAYWIDLGADPPVVARRRLP